MFIYRNWSEGVLVEDSHGRLTRRGRLLGPPNGIVTNASRVAEKEQNSAESRVYQNFFNPGSDAERAIETDLLKVNRAEVLFQPEQEKFQRCASVFSETSATSVNLEESSHPASVQKSENSVVPPSKTGVSVPVKSRKKASGKSIRSSVAKKATKIQNKKAVDITPFVDSPISHMPNEILHKIFSYLPLRELCDSAMLVCRKWNEQANYSDSWSSVDFTKIKKSNERNFKGKNLLDHHCRSNRVKQIRCNNLTYSFMEKVVTKCPKLREFIIENFKEAPPGTLEMLSVSCPTLKSIVVLSFPDNDFDLNGLVLNEIYLNKNLTELTILHKLSLPNLIALANSSNLLRKLAVDIGSFNEAGSSVLLNLQGSLEVVRLTCDYLTPDLKNALHSCLKLKFLEIKTMRSIVDMSMDHLCEHQTHLEVLSLKSAPNTVFDSIPSMFHRVKFPNVSILNISFSGRVYESGQRLLIDELISAFPSLQKLYFKDSSDYFGVAQPILFKQLKMLYFIKLRYTKEAAHLVLLACETCKHVGIITSLHMY